jgi:hypothetical protein
MSTAGALLAAVAGLRDEAAKLNLSNPPTRVGEYGYQRRQRAFAAAFPDLTKAAQVALVGAVEAFLATCETAPGQWGTLERARDRVLAAWEQVVFTTCSPTLFEWQDGGPDYLLAMGRVGDSVYDLLLLQEEAEHAAQIPELIRVQLRDFRMSPYRSERDRVAA